MSTLPSKQVCVCADTSGATLSLSILILNPLLVQPVVFLLLLVCHIGDPALVAATCRTLRNAASAAIDFESLLNWRLSRLLTGPIHVCARIVAVCVLRLGCGLAVDRGGDRGEGLALVRRWHFCGRLKVCMFLTVRL